MWRCVSLLATAVMCPVMAGDAGGDGSESSTAGAFGGGGRPFVGVAELGWAVVAPYVIQGTCPARGSD